MAERHFSTDRGTYRYSKVPPEARHLLRVPRTARLVAQLPDSEFQGLRNSADVYWKAYTHNSTDKPTVEDHSGGLIQSGLMAAKLFARHSTAPMSFYVLDKQIAAACTMLGGIGFEMLCGGLKPRFAIDGEMFAFQSAVLDRMTAAEAFPAGRGDDEWFGNDWDCLLEMDSVGLGYYVFSQNDANARLGWTDVTTMAFWAAHWLCRWRDAEDRERLHKAFKELGDDIWFEVWRFAAELPADAVDAERRAALFAPIYDRSIGSDRATEFIFRSWQQMKGSPPRTAFLAEFPAIRAGKQGAASKAIADRMMSGFIPLASKDSTLPGDTGTFLMGAAEGEEAAWHAELPQQLVTVRGPYQLHRTCVTNEEFCLFSPRKDWQRKFGVRLAGDLSRHPAVDVNWYDAWCFARWCGCRLPSEAEWEYACRAGWTTAFTFGASCGGDTCTADECNFKGNQPYGKTKEQCTASERQYRRATIPVDGLPANPWGFHQMHGNVWDWCWDWFDALAYRRRSSDVVDAQGADVWSRSARVLRGGSWHSNGRYCRSSRRYSNRPGYRRRRVGFRLARSS